MFKVPSRPTASTYYRLGVPFSFFFIFASLALIGFSWRKLPPQVPLFYSRPWGEEILAPSFSLFGLPLIAVLVTFLNLLFILRLGQNRLLVTILAGSSILFAFLVFWTIFKIIGLVT